MRKLIFTSLILLLLTSPAWAVRVVCDPNTSAVGGYYVITGLPSCVGTGVNISAQIDGSISLDVSCVAIGTTWPTVVKVCNIWGDCSSTVNFTLARPTVPSAVLGIRLSP